MNLSKLMRLREQIENDYKPLLTLAAQIKKRMEDGMTDRDAWNIVPGEKQRQFADVEGNNYQRKIEMLAELFSTHGTVVYPAMGNDYVFRKLGSKLIGIDSDAYRHMTPQEKRQLVSKGIELIEQDAIDVPDKVKKGYDVLVLKSFMDVLRKFTGFETTHIRPTYHTLKKYIQHLRPGGYVVDCDGFDKELKELGMVESEIPAPYKNALEMSVPPTSFAIGGQSIPKGNFRIYKKPMVRVLPSVRVLD